LDLAFGFLLVVVVLLVLVSRLELLVPEVLDPLLPHPATATVTTSASMAVGSVRLLMGWDSFVSLDDVGPSPYQAFLASNPPCAEGRTPTSTGETTADGTHDHTAKQRTMRWHG
jgi:hypothetical protein